MIDLTAAWEQHAARVLGDRGDEHRLHASDLHACDYATYLRVKGDEQLPNDDAAFAVFERGFAYEARAYEALRAYAAGFTVTHGREVDYAGIVGHVDFTIEDGDDVLAVIDVTTTAAKSTDWKYGHVLKSAFYAVALGAPRFCDWVFAIGFGGTIAAQEAHWFELDAPAGPGADTWRNLVRDTVDLKLALIGQDGPPLAAPPIDPRTLEMETWRCGKGGKSYCRARCDYNARYKPL